MTVKCERGMIWSSILSIFCIIVVSFMFYYDFGSLGLWVWFPFAFLFFCLLTSALVKVARTFVFDKDGCTIELLGHRKMIPWSRIKYIRIESYPHMATNRFPYSGAIVFTTKRIYHSTKARVTKYNLIGTPTLFSSYHPFSHIYVYFEANPPVKYTRFNYPRYSREFCVDENTFINLLKEWNVPLPEKVKITRDWY